MLHTGCQDDHRRASTIESRARAVERVINSMHVQMDDKRDDPLSLHELAEIAILPLSLQPRLS